MRLNSLTTVGKKKTFQFTTAALTFICLKFCTHELFPTDVSISFIQEQYVIREDDATPLLIMVEVSPDPGVNASGSLALVTVSNQMCKQVHAVFVSVYRKSLNRSPGVYYFPEISSWRLFKIDVYLRLAFVNYSSITRGCFRHTQLNYGVFLSVLHIESMIRVMTSTRDLDYEFFCSS